MDKVTLLRRWDERDDWAAYINKVGSFRTGPTVLINLSPLHRVRYSFAVNPTSLKMKSLVALSVLTLAAAVLAYPQVSNRPSQDRFVTVNGLRLHYLDWGGRGDALLFLTSLGGTADDFQTLAVQFTDHFHVLSLTRRGQGQSDKPAKGYDTATLTEDIKAFLDAMKITRVSLVGYSVAGNEETEFAGKYPERVVKLVYLDAAYDLAELAEHRRAHLDLPEPSGLDKSILEILERSNEYHPDYSRIQAPALGFFVTSMSTTTEIGTPSRVAGLTNQSRTVLSAASSRPKPNPRKILASLI